VTVEGTNVNSTNKPAPESTLDDEEQQAYQQLLSDYKAAAAVHVPSYCGGGLARKIAVALIKEGWRKQQLK